MAALTESQKVGRIVDALERELNGDLFLRDTERKIGRLKVVRRGFGSELGRPDAVVWLEIETHVLGVLVSLKVPILVEGEDAGIQAAVTDFELFFERDTLEIPMVVVGKRGAVKKQTTRKATAKVEVPIHLVGFDRIETRG